MLLYSENLRIAYKLKEDFYKLLELDNYEEQKRNFKLWISWAESTDLKEFREVVKTYNNWYREILNSFKYKTISNGITEGFNNKIKVLKRILWC